MRRTNIYLGDVQHKRLKVMGKKMGLKVSEIIRRMIDEGLKRYEKTANR
ncbi:MAG TPA: CopG family transcriptional regulator [Thermodesulfobacteriota bacterium]|nr:CopG family transcriptional regulator [Thermodesulfobacteriota bacterium]